MGKAISQERTVNALQQYYEKQEVATRECLYALKSIVLSLDENISHKRKYQIPFFVTRNIILVFYGFTKRKLLSVSLKTKKALRPQKNI